MNGFRTIATLSVLLLFNNMSFAECPKHLSGLAAEIWQAAERDASSSRKSAQTSPIRGNESLVLKNFSPAVDHIISLSSGPDVFRPLVAFPHAKTIHLVDSLVGWGDAPAETIREIDIRLRNLSPDVEVTRTEDGFLRDHPLDPFKSGGEWWAYFSTTSSRMMNISTQPVRWKVSWISPSNGKQTREFVLHVFDYNDVSALDRMLRDILINGEKLEGIMVTGAPFPDLESFQILKENLAHQAWFIWEKFQYSHKVPPGDVELDEVDRDRIEGFLETEEEGLELVRQFIEQGFSVHILPLEENPLFDHPLLTTPQAVAMQKSL